jgi:hypothetical protein
MRIDTVPCTVRANDGSPCGRRVKRTDVLPGTPAVCHVHRNVALGNPNNGGQPFARRPKSAEDVIDALMYSKDETVRLRAADAFLKRQERQTTCPTCAANRVEDRERTSAVHRLTYEQRGQLKALLASVRELLELARTQKLTWDPDQLQYIDTPTEAPSLYAPTPPAAPPVFTEEPDDAEEEEIEEDFDPLTEPPSDES